MKYNASPGAVEALASLAIILLTTQTMASLSAPGTGSVASVTRQNNGDLFSAPGDNCNVDTCVGLSSGTAGAASPSSFRPGNGRSCTCKCLDHLPTYREDLHICIDDIHECSLAPFVSGSTSQQIPYVYLPLKGQIVHPSKEISFAGVKTPICAISSAQFLTKSGWIELRNPMDNDVPFRLFRDEGRTFLQWLGDPDLRMKMVGRLILIQLLCKDLGKDPNANDLKSIFTPCVAFRVAGSSTKYISNVSEVVFSPDAHASNLGSSNGLTVSEYIAIGICSILLGLIYVASVFLYLHIRRRKRKDDLEKDTEKLDEQSLAPGDEIIVKNNPLLTLSRHFVPPDNTFSDSGSSDDMTPDILQLQEDTRKKQNQLQITSAIIHPLNENFSMALCSNESVQVQDTASIERLPEENVSIVETLEGREDRPETVKTIVSATQRRKLYFNPAYFEPHLLLAPPPAAIEFLTKIREVISIAKQKMASKRFTPSLLGIPEEDFTPSIDQMYDFSLGLTGSRRSSMISLKRRNSRRKIQCSGCPGCEPQDLKSFCGKLSDFPSIRGCKSCCQSTSSTIESKQQSIRKWLEDVPVLKPISTREELSEACDSSLKSVHDKSIPSTPNSHKKPSKCQTLDKDQVCRKSIKESSTENNFNDNSIERAKSPSSCKQSTNKISNKMKSPIKSRPNKAKAPAPPIPKNSKTPVKKSIKNLENIKPNLSNQYDVIRNIRTPSPKQHLPPPDMINEAIVVDQAEEVPQTAKVMMAAVINEFTTQCRIEDKVKTEDLPKIEVVSDVPPQTPTVDYETDSLERNGKKNGYSTPTEYANVSSSQPSPSLSNALPMDEEMTMQNETFDVKPIEKQIESELDDDHEYELIVLPKQDKKPLIDVLNKKLYKLPELLQRNNGYNLVSEVYVNNGYNFGSTPSTPSGSSVSTLENKPKIRYAQPDEKPGHLTIEVEDCPNNYIRVDSDNFEPDTLDRKSSKFKLSMSSNDTNSSDYIDSLERPNHILLKTTGSFKSDTLNNASEIGYALNSNFTRTFGSLREIYEAKTRNYLRPGLENITFVGPLHSPNSESQKTLSWNKYNESEEGKLLTLEERQKKRQRESPKGSLKQIPPDVIPPSPVQSPIYEQPKPPRKVIIDDFKPPLPPKNANGRNTSMKNSSSCNKITISPSSTISFKSQSYTSGVSAQNMFSSDGEQYQNQFNNLLNEKQNKTILQNFIHADDIIVKNGINREFILHASTVNTRPNFKNIFTLPPSSNSNQINSLDKHLHDETKNENVKRTWRKMVHSSSTQHKEDSGYLSTESNDSNRKKKEMDKESDTDESLGDGHSESGAESIETHSVFFGTYRKLSRFTESIDSGVGSECFRPRENVVLLPDMSRKSNSLRREFPG